MIKRMVLEEGGGSWQNCRARRVSTSLSEGFGGSERVLKFFEVLEGCGPVEKGPGE